ncbi:MAG: class I SAM-dependent methyltransferase [Leeuwenhoekiella sp.]
MNTYGSYFNVNRETWNKKTAVHAASDFYAMQDFINGKTSLNKFELDALGDVSGKKMLHLQCHFGQDTLSWSRLGARCTGVDIADEAIALARKYTEQLQLDARFVCCKMLDTPDHLNGQFNIVYTSYGVLSWLPDFEPWGEIVSKMLRPGRTFYIVEFHPIAWMFDYLEEPPKMKYGYNQEEMI